MPIEVYEDLPTASDEEVIEFLRDQIFDVLQATGKNYNIIVAAFNTIINEIRKRLIKTYEWNCSYCGKILMTSYYREQNTLYFCGQDCSEKYLEEKVYSDDE